MLWNRRSGLLSLLLLASAAFPTQSQTVSCAGLPAWSATTTYAAGAQVSYSGSLYKALVSTTNVQPSYCPACGWWQLVGVCGSVTTCTTVPSVPAGLASPSQTTSSVNLTWIASTAASGCTVSYRVFQNGAQVATPATNGATIGGLAANTT